MHVLTLFLSNDIMVIMNIAVFSDVFLEVPGGIPSSIIAQKKSLEKLGHKVTIFAPGFTNSRGEATGLADKDILKDVVVVPTHRHLRLNGAPLSKAPGKVERWINEKYPMFSDFDLVHVHYEASCSLAGVRLARKFKIPLVQTMHGREDMAIAVNVPHPFKTIAGSLLNFLHSKYISHEIKIERDEKLAPTIARAKMWTLMVNHANYADAVLTPSEHFAEKLKHYGVSKPVTVVSNGVADEMVAKFERKVGKDNLVRRKKTSEPLKIFWNSRLSQEKRIMPFLEALRMMREPFFFSACGDGNEFKNAQKFVVRNGLSGKIRLYGRVPHEEVLDKMLDQHLSVTVSYGFDTQGLTLLEAEAVGLPVFFCDPDMREVVPEKGAVMADGPDPKSMAKALDKIARDSKLIESMSKEMLARRKEILQSAQIKKLIAVYQSLAKK